MNCQSVQKNLWNMSRDLGVDASCQSMSFISLFADVAIAKGICGPSRNIDWSCDLWCNSYENWMFFSDFQVNFVIGNESTFTCGRREFIGGIRGYLLQMYRSCVRDLSHTIHEKILICYTLNFYKKTSWFFWQYKTIPVLRSKRIL